MTKLNKIAIHGAPRSGTSWLGEILNSSPNTIYKYQPLFSYALKDFLSPNSTINEIEQFFSILESRADNFLDQTDNRLKKKLPVFEKTNSTHIVYKEVRYHHILGNLLEKTKKLRLVGIIRNPLSVIYSWLKAPREFRSDLGWKEMDEWRTAPSKNLNRPEEFFGYDKWKEAVIIFKQLQQQYPNRVKLIRYEELMQNTNEVVRDLFQFCNLPITKQTLEFLKQSKLQTVPGTYAVYRRGNTSNKWRGNLNPNILDEIVNDLSNSDLKIFLNQVSD